MKVKEVYHYLTVLSSWEDDVNSAMNNKMLLVRTLENHKKNAVFATEQDEKREIVDMQVHYTFDELVKMWETIINEKEKIYDLIEKKKVEYGVPDTIFTMSKSYRRLMNALKAASRQSQQSVITQKGTGFIKSGEGVGEYKYDIEVTSIPKYESKYFIDNLDKFTKIADDNSNKIDSFNTNVEIDYTPRWSEYSKLEDIIKQ